MLTDLSWLWKNVTDLQGFPGDGDIKKTAVVENVILCAFSRHNFRTLADKAEVIP